MVRNQRARRLAELLARCLSRRGAARRPPFAVRSLVYKSARISTSGRETMRQRDIVRGAARIILRYRGTSSRYQLTVAIAFFQRSLLSTVFPSLQRPLSSAIESPLFSVFSLLFSGATVRISLRPYCTGPPPRRQSSRNCISVDDWRVITRRPAVRASLRITRTTAN